MTGLVVGVSGDLDTDDDYIVEVFPPQSQEVFRTQFTNEQYHSETKTKQPILP